VYVRRVFGHPRHQHILDRLHRDGRVDVAELTVALDTSEVTIRSLDILAEQGTLRCASPRSVEI